MEIGAQADSVSVYEMPRIYDIAFGYRDVRREVRVLGRWYAALAGRAELEAVVEVACGPAAHAREFARLGARVVALDRSRAMCDYAEVQASEAGIDLEVRCVDMADFGLEQPQDLIISMLDSTSHLLDLDRMVGHLTAVRNALHPGGLYVAEMAHPGDFMTTRPRTITRWVQRRGDTEVRIAWGADGDQFDPTTQVGQATVLLRVTGPEGIRTLVDSVAYRRWTRMEIEACARLAGLEVVEWFGALDAVAPFDNEPGSWRMIPVMRRPVRDPRRRDRRAG